MSDCDKYRSQLEMFALSSNASEFPDLASHLEHCAECRSHFDEIREAWLEIPAELSAIEPSAALRSSVMESLNEPSGIRPSTSGSKSPETTEDQPLGGRLRMLDLLKYGLAASVLIGLFYSYTKFKSPKADAPAARQVVRDGDTVDPLAEQIADLDSSKMRYVALMRVATQTPVATHVLCDLTSRQVHFVLFGLDDFDRENTYKIWLLGSQDQVFASSNVQINEGHVGKALLSLPSNLGHVTQVIVTREVNSGAVEPSDEVLLGGPIDGKSWSESQ